MTTSLQKNVEKLQESVLTKNFSEAILACQDIELEIDELMTLRNYFPSDIFQNTHLDFYATYLFCLFRTENLNEAKYLWKRTPELFKTVNNNNNTTEKNLFSAGWEVGKLLFQDNISQALKLLESNNSLWAANQIVSFLVQDIQDHYLQKLFYSLSSSYNPVNLGTVAKYLESSEDVAKNLLNQYGFSINAQNEITKPTQSSFAVQSSKELNNHILSIEKLAQYAHHLSREPPKIDMAALANQANAAPSGNNNSSSTATKQTKSQK